MEKKLTKKELKEIEERQNQLRRLRGEVINSALNLEKDIEATKRYYKLNKMTDKLNYDRLTLEEEIKLTQNYPCLDFVKPYKAYTEEELNNGEDRARDFLRLMIKSDSERNSLKGRKLEQYLPNDAILIDDIIWDTKQVKLYLKLAQEFGYTQIYYTNSSSGALSNITDFINFGAKVIGTCSKKGYNEKAGLILDITEVNLEEAKEVE